MRTIHLFLALLTFSIFTHTTLVSANPTISSAARSEEIVSKTPADFGHVSLLAASLAVQLSRACPLTDAASESHFIKCKQVL